MSNKNETLKEPSYITMVLQVEAIEEVHHLWTLLAKQTRIYGCVPRALAWGDVVGLPKITDVPKDIMDGILKAQKDNSN